jgi:hypothetical protein
MAPTRDSSAMTRPTSGVILQAGDPRKIEEDKNEVRDYVKEVLFKKNSLYLEQRCPSLHKAS